MKHIRMSRETADKWLAALRSGDYKQGKHSLYNDKKFGDQGFCCLGVLEHAVSGELEKDGTDFAFEPSLNWLKENGIEFYSLDGKLDNSPWVELAECDIMTLNDGNLGATEGFEGLTFNQIADFIETELEYV